MEDRLLNATEVSLLIGSSLNSIDNEYAQLLPDYVQKSNHQTRMWRQSDIGRLIEFKTKIPKGRNGILGCVTQKWNKNSKKHYRKDENYGN